MTYLDRTKIESYARVAAPIALSPKQSAQYSVLRVVRNLAGMDDGDAGLEREVSKTLESQVGRPTAGMFIPTRLYAAGLDTKTNAAGAYTAATEIGELIELLRNKLRVAKLGATVLTGLRGNQQFPRQMAASSGAWVSQNPGSDVADSDAAFGILTLSPKTYAASTSFSRQFLSQSTIDAEALVRSDLATAHALAIDLAAIAGSGAANQPLGLLNTSGIGSVALGTNGAGPTYNSIVDLESALANANADEAGMKFLTTPVMRARLRKTQQFTGTNGVPVWTNESGAGPGVGSMLGGFASYVSKQVPSTLVKGSSGAVCHAIIFGNWPSMLIGEWGVIEIVVDPFRLKKQGMIEVTSFQMVDVGLRQPAQFAAIQDALDA